MPTPGAARERVGALYAVLAFGAWGLVPLFWKQIAAVPAGEIVLHRIVWATPVFVGLAIAGGQLHVAIEILRGPRRWGMLAAASLLAANWLCFLVAVTTDRVIEVSLGYFLNPLLSVLLGRVVLGERLSRAGWTAVVLAGAGVGVLCTQAPSFPWVGLGVAGTFGGYGLVRKMTPVPALAGSAGEILWLLPLALTGLAVLAFTGRVQALDHGPGVAILVAATGLVTALPLAAFAQAVRRLPLAAIGFFQFLAPTGQFLLATLWWHEPFLVAVHLPGFGLIWLGLAIFLVDAGRGGTSSTR